MPSALVKVSVPFRGGGLSDLLFRVDQTVPLVSVPFRGGGLSDMSNGYYDAEILAVSVPFRGGGLSDFWDRVSDYVSDFQYPFGVVGYRTGKSLSQGNNTCSFRPLSGWWVIGHFRHDGENPGNEFPSPFGVVGYRTWLLVLLMEAGRGFPAP